MQQHLTKNNDITSVNCSTLKNKPNKHNNVFINSFTIHFLKNKKQAFVFPMPLWPRFFANQCDTQPAKLDLNKKSFPMQKTIQNFTIDGQGFRKTKNENPPTWEV